VRYYSMHYVVLFYHIMFKRYFWVFFDIAARSSLTNQGRIA
jgi:hypothetical protein